MADKISTPNYLKANTELMREIDRYIDYLAADGRSNSNLANIRAAIRSFFARCPVPAGSINAKVMSSVLDVMKSDGLHPVYCKQSALYVGRFLGWSAGTNPYLDINPDGESEWYVGHLGAFRFQPDLDEYIRSLRDQGYSEYSCHRNSFRIRILLRVLDHDLGITELEQVDEACFDHLAKMMSPVKSYLAANAVFNLRRFLDFCLGSVKEREIDNDSPEWKDFRSRYDEYMQEQEERGLRPRTLITIRRSIIRGYQIATSVYGPIYVSQIDRHAIRMIRSQMTGIGQRTLRLYLCHFGKFIEHSTGINPYRQADMVWGIESPRRTWITHDQWHSLWDSADTTQKLILALAAGLGLRRAEIASLKMCDISRTEITIRGKGSGSSGKVVTKPLPPSVKTCIDHYLAVRNDLVVSEDIAQDNLILMARRRRGSPASAGFIEGCMNSLKEKTGIEFSCHTLRRYYCMVLYDAGTDLDTLRRMMRHENISTTMEKYLNADPRRIIEATKTVENMIFD